MERWLYNTLAAGVNSSNGQRIESNLLPTLLVPHVLHVMPLFKALQTICSLVRGNWVKKKPSCLKYTENCQIDFWVNVKNKKKLIRKCFMLLLPVFFMLCYILKSIINVRYTFIKLRIFLLSTFFNKNNRSNSVLLTSFVKLLLLFIILVHLIVLFILCIYSFKSICKPLIIRLWKLQYNIILKGK